MATHVFVAVSTCGHAQSVYADVPQDGSPLAEPWANEIIGDLRAGLTLKRITIQEYHRDYVRTLLCGCRTVGHERHRERPKGERDCAQCEALP